MNWSICMTNVERYYSRTQNWENYNDIRWFLRMWWFHVSFDGRCVFFMLARLMSYHGKEIFKNKVRQWGNKCSAEKD